MPPKVPKHLEDIRDSADLIGRYTAGLTYEQYVDDLQTRDAVERRFTIIGEALERLKRDAPEVHARIDRVDEIKAFRNIIVHVYHALELKTVWRVIHQELPHLREQVAALLTEVERESG